MKKRGFGIVTRVRSLSDYKKSLTLVKIAEGFKRRVRNKWDVTAVFTGEVGTGKTSLANQLAHLVDKDFDLYKQVLWSESSGDAIELIKDLKPYQAILYDEGENQFSKDDWFSRDSKDFNKEYTVNRSENKIHLICIPHFARLTKFMRENRVKYWFHCFVKPDKEGNIKRGYAILLKRTGVNPVESSSWNDDLINDWFKKKAKKGQAVSTQEFLRFVSKLPNVYKRVITFQPMPVKYEEKYNALKDERKRRVVNMVEKKTNALLESLKKYVVMKNQDIKTKNKEELSKEVGVTVRTIQRWFEKYNSVVMTTDTTVNSNNNSGGKGNFP